MQLTRTHQRYCLSDDCSEAPRCTWSPHNHECSSCWWGMTREGVARYFLRVAVRRTHSGAAEEAGYRWEEPSSLQIIYPLSVSTRLDFLCSQICHAVSFKWNTFRTSNVCHGSVAAPGTGHPWWCPHWERGMSAAVAASERMQVLGPEQWRGTSSRLGCGFECSESIHKVNVEPVEKPLNSLSIRLCSSHRHFPKKLAFPLQEHIRGLHAQDTLTEVVLARAFSAVPCCFWRSVLWLDAPHTAARFPHATPSRVATPCFHILAKESKTSLGNCFFKPQNLLLASIKPPWKFKAFHEV